MDIYPLLVFLHVLGAVGMFAAWGVEMVAVSQLRQAVTVDQARTAMGLRRGSAPMAPVAMFTALGTGLWMMGVRWGLRPWIVTALAGLVLIVSVGIVLARHAMPRLAAALEGAEQRLPGSVHAAREILVTSLRLRVAIGVGVLGLMTMKPGALESVTIMAAAIAIGLAAGIPSRRRLASTAVRQ